MSKAKELLVHIKYDEEASRWYVAKSDVPGLRLEADDPFVLMSRIAAAAPELIELNNQRKDAHSRPALGWKPVFDSPLQLADA